MSRDFRKLHVFQLADELLLRVYQTSAAFPATERYTLQAQLRRAALSAAANIVEGSARRTTRYLADVSRRLRYLPEKDAVELVSRYTELSAKLHALLASLASEP